MASEEKTFSYQSTRDFIASMMASVGLPVGTQRGKLDGLKMNTLLSDEVKEFDVKEHSLSGYRGKYLIDYNGHRMPGYEGFGERRYSVGSDHQIWIGKQDPNVRDLEQGLKALPPAERADLANRGLEKLARSSFFYKEVMIRNERTDDPVRVYAVTNNIAAKMEVLLNNGGDPNVLLHSLSEAIKDGKAHYMTVSNAVYSVMEAPGSEAIAAKIKPQIAQEFMAALINSPATKQNPQVPPVGDFGFAWHRNSDQWLQKKLVDGNGVDLAPMVSRVIIALGVPKDKDGKPISVNYGGIKSSAVLPVALSFLGEDYFMITQGVARHDLDLAYRFLKKYDPKGDPNLMDTLRSMPGNIFLHNLDLVLERGVTFRERDANGRTFAHHAMRQWLDQSTDPGGAVYKETLEKVLELSDLNAKDKFGVSVSSQVREYNRRNHQIEIVQDKAFLDQMAEQLAQRTRDLEKRRAAPNPDDIKLPDQTLGRKSADLPAPALLQR